MTSFSVVIIGLNEANNFPRIANNTNNVLREISDDYEIILVNDGSTDGTREAIEQSSRELSCIRVLHHEKNLGIGASLRNGYGMATKELITCLAADGQIDPADIKRLYQAMDPRIDFVTSVYATRRDSLLRDILSLSFRTVLFVLFGPLPRFEGSYMFRRDVLKEIRLYSDTFVFNFEIIIKAYKRKFSFAEISTDYIPRKEGKSKVLHLRSISKVLFELLKLRWLLWMKGI